MGGTCIIAGYNPEDGSTISLTDEQIELASKYLEKNHVQKMDMQMAYYTMLAQENVM